MELKKKNWNSITIGDYMDLQEIIKREEAVDVEVGIVSLLCGVDEDEIGNLPIPKYQRLRREAQFIATFPEIKNKSPKTIVLNERKYDVISDIRKLTTAQYIDFQTYLKMENMVQLLPNILTVFIIPKGCTYGDDEYNIDDLAKDIKEYLPVVTAYEMCGFFQKAFFSSINNTIIYLESKMKKMMKRAKTEQEKKKIQEILASIKTLSNINGVGFHQLM